MKTGMWTRRIVAATTLILFSHVLIAQGRENGAHFVLRVIESELTMRPTAGPHIVDNCLLVERDGSMHLQLRRIEIIGEAPTLLAYQAKLRPEWLNRLRAILIEEKVMSLATYKEPVRPFDADRFHWFLADIDRGRTIQRVGYFDWVGEGPRNEEADKRRWNEAKSVLKPLAEWSRAAKMLNSARWQAVPYSPRSECFTPDEDQGDR